MTKANIDEIMQLLKDGKKPAEIGRMILGGKKVYPRDVADAKRRLEKSIKKPIIPIKNLSKPIIKAKPTLQGLKRYDTPLDMHLSKPIESYQNLIKTYQKPINFIDSLDVDTFLLWIKGLDPTKYHGGRRTMINRLQKYKTSTFIEGVVGLLKLYKKEMKL